MKHLFRISIFVVLLSVTSVLSAQVSIGGDQTIDIDYLIPKRYEIAAIDIEGATGLNQRMILLVSGLEVGAEIKLPGDKISTAIDNLWKQGLFEDVQILLTRVQGNKAFLKI